MTRPNASCDTAPRSPLSTRIGFTRNKGLLAGIVDVLIDWQDRTRSRVMLSRLDDRMLHDMGLSRADVDFETTKPFWRP